MEDDVKADQYQHVWWLGVAADVTAFVQGT